MEKNYGLVGAAIATGICIAIFMVSTYGKGTREAVPPSSEVPTRTESTVAHMVAEGPGIRIMTPKAGFVIESPMKITGEAVGNWYFEGSFPVSVTDADGTVLGSGTAQAEGDWMTEGLVPFQAELTFDPRGAKNGVVVFSKDNPSGLPEHAGSFSVPVMFGN